VIFGNHLFVFVAAEQNKEVSNSINVNDCALIEAIVRTYNRGLVFDPSEDRMAYTIRDPLTSGTLLLLLLSLILLLPLVTSASQWHKYALAILRW